MKKGDVFYVHNLGQTLAYKVDQIKVIKPTQVDQLKIVKGKDLCTLMTCTPYMINTHRLLVTGHRIPYNPKAEAKAKERIRNRLFWNIIAILLPVLGSSSSSGTRSGRRSRLRQTRKKNKNKQVKRAVRIFPDSPFNIFRD